MSPIPTADPKWAEPPENNCAHLAWEHVDFFFEIDETETIKINKEVRHCLVVDCGAFFDAEVGREQYIKPVYDWDSRTYKTPD